MQLFLKDYTNFGKNSSAWKEQFTVCFWYFAQEMILSVAQNQILKKRIRKQKKNLLYTCFPIVFLLFCDILLLGGFLLTADLLCNCRL